MKGGEPTASKAKLKKHLLTSYTKLFIHKAALKHCKNKACKVEASVAHPQLLVSVPLEEGNMIYITNPETICCFFKNTVCFL